MSWNAEALQKGARRKPREGAAGPPVRNKSAKLSPGAADAGRSAHPRAAHPGCAIAEGQAAGFATLKSRRSLSFKLRKTCRLSFSDCASGMCSSRVSRPTGISGSGGQLSGLLPTGGPAALSGSFCGAHFRHAKAFENVPDLYVVEVRNACATLKSGAYFTGVILETLQRTELRSVNHGAIAQYAHLRVTLQDAVDHVAAANRTRPFHSHSLAHFRPAQICFRDHRLEQAFHSLLQLVRNFVNDRVRPDVHMILLGQGQRLAVRP